MPGKQAKPLNVREIESKKTPGMFADGNGLYLRVTKGGAKNWIFRYMMAGKSHDMGLGVYPFVNLAEARKKAFGLRQKTLSGIDPLKEKQDEELKKQIEAAKTVSFKSAAENYIRDKLPEWKNPKHLQQWNNTLANYVYPVFGGFPVAEIDTPLVLKVFEPIWQTKTVTATKVRQRIEAILDWAKSRGYRSGENPARWNGHLDNLLADPGKVSKTSHHPALPYREIGAFMETLRDRSGIGDRGLEFCILTCARTMEVINADWSEFDLEARVWTIPASRMKADRDHRIPLCDRAVEILRNMPRVGDRPPFKVGKNAFLQILASMGRDDLTAHGFRSTFRDWAAEKTSFPSEVAELALAHWQGSKVEQAYRRGDMFEKRRQLAEAWARFCERTSGEVIPLRKQRN